MTRLMELAPPVELKNRPGQARNKSKSEFCTYLSLARCLFSSSLLCRPEYDGYTRLQEEWAEQFLGVVRGNEQILGVVRGNGFNLSSEQERTVNLLSRGVRTQGVEFIQGYVVNL